jgi:hypothetical protein
MPDLRPKTSTGSPITVFWFESRTQSRSHIGHRRPFVIAIDQGKGVTESHKSDPAAKEIIALWNELNKLCPVFQKAKTEKQS